jgi:hypothetical protein
MTSKGIETITAAAPDAAPMPMSTTWLEGGDEIGWRLEEGR